MDDEVGSDTSQFKSGPAGEPECSSELICLDDTRQVGQKAPGLGCKPSPQSKLKGDDV